MKTTSFCVGLLMMISASLANAAPILPSGLAPGSTYFLAFVTADPIVAFSSDITTYDAFVTAQANSDPTLAALATTWNVIGSTATVDAITHIGVTGPVFNLVGQLVATGAADMFDGSLGAPILYDQHGDRNETYVWTGSNPSGTGSPDHQLGSDSPMAGYSLFTTAEWIRATGSQPPLAPLPLYGISGPLEAPTPVPEPSTISLMLGPLLLGMYRRWRPTFAKPTS